jgi:fructose-specific component phosphotransferase system IIB-like protein
MSGKRVVIYRVAASSTPDAVTLAKAQAEAAGHTVLWVEHVAMSSLVRGQWLVYLRVAA